MLKVVNKQNLILKMKLSSFTCMTEIYIGEPNYTQSSLLARNFYTSQFSVNVVASSYHFSNSPALDVLTSSCALLFVICHTHGEYIPFGSALLSAT